MNIFPIFIITAFTFAGIVEYLSGNTAKAVFYVLSAMLNVNILFLR